MVEKIDLYEPSPEEHVGRVVVGVWPAVDDVTALMVKVHDGLERFKRDGVRKIWVYRALDDGREVMILQEIGARGRCPPVDRASRRSGGVDVQGRPRGRIPTSSSASSPI